MLKCFFLFASFAIALIRVCLGQHSVGFQIPIQVCLGEVVAIQNTSDPGDAQWKFCNSLEGAYESSVNGIISPSLGGMSIIENNGLWIGFAVTSNNQLIKINFGDNPSNSNYTVNSLGNPGGLLQNPDWIHVIKSNDKWYALVTNQTNEIIRLIWSDLELSPTAQSLNLSSTGMFNAPAQVEIEKDGSNYVAIVANSGSNQLTLINFGESMENNPVSTDLIQSPILSGSINMFGVTAKQLCGQWTIYTTVTDKLYKINVGSQLFSPIDVSQILDFSSDIPVPIGKYVRLKSIAEGEDVYLYFTSYTSSFISGAIWRQAATNAEFIDLTTLAAPNQLYSFEIYSYNNSYGFYIGSFNTGQIYNIQIDYSCPASQSISYEFSPQGIYFVNPGNHSILLSMEFSDGTICAIRKSIIVNNQAAPDISFTSQNSCANHDVLFTSQNTSGNITDYNWNFGDTNTSMLQDPTHQYAAAGDYPVILQVTASNGCNNLARDTLTIYSEPIPSFDLPAASPICSNQEYLFTNTSTFDVGSNPAWSWEVNGVPLSTNQDLLFTIPSTVMQDIKLIAAIPGCENEIINTINTVEEGPLADFTFMNGCEDSIIDFINVTTGTVSGYLWDFDNGNTSTQVDASNTFVDYGQYNVNLQASNVAGCINNIVKQITVYSKPQTDFSIDLPPFSCSGSPSQFNDLTPNPPDSNLDTWTWSFGDPLNGTSTTRNPQYIYAASGDYNVNLDATTNFGCTTSIQKQVTISESPGADFTFNPACVNQATTFTPTSSSGISSWQWKIGTATYNQQIPIHVFGSSSTFSAELTATSNNGCVSLLSKQFIVPIPSTPDFSSANNCALQSTVFTDITASASDPVASRSWQFGTLGNGTGLTSSFTFPSSGSYPTKLTITNTSGCTYIISKNVSVNNSPVPTFTATPTVGTPPLMVQVVNTTPNAISQIWTVNNPENSTSSEVATNFTLSELGQYVVDLTVSNLAGCSAATSKIISVIVPSLDIELTSLSINPSISGEINLLISVKNNSNSPISNPKAIIDISGGVLISEILNMVIQPGQTYSQVLTTGIVKSKEGIGYICVELNLDGDFDITNNKLCLNQESKAVVLDPYPNPGANQMTIEWISADQSKVDIFIFDPIGRKVYDNSVGDFESGLNRIIIPLQTLNPGMYYILFVSEGVRKSFQYVVRR